MKKASSWRIFQYFRRNGHDGDRKFCSLDQPPNESYKDQEYLNYVLFNHATVPDRTAYILDRSEENPMPFLLDDIENKIYCDQTSLC